MDTQTYIQKITDAIYEGCDKSMKRRKWKTIHDSVEEVVDNANTERVPYYYLGVLQVIEDMHLEESHSDEMDEKLKKLSKEHTLFKVDVIVTDLFESYVDDDEDVVIEFVQHFKDGFVEKFKYEELVKQDTTTIINNIRAYSFEFVKNMDFDFAHFDRELTDSLYDTIDCEEEVEEDDDFIEVSDDDEEDETEDEDETESDAETDAEDAEEYDLDDEDDLHDLLDQKIEEIRDLKSQINSLQSTITTLQTLNEGYIKVADMEKQRADSMRSTIVICISALISFIVSPTMLSTKFTFPSNLLE